MLHFLKPLKIKVQVYDDIFGVLAIRDFILLMYSHFIFFLNKYMSCRRSLETGYIAAITIAVTLVVVVIVVILYITKLKEKKMCSGNLLLKKQFGDTMMNS